MIDQFMDYISALPTAGMKPHPRPELVLERFFGSGEMGADGGNREKISFLAEEHCHAERPDCGSCPLQLFCRHGRQLRTAPAGAIPFIDLFCGAGGLSTGLEEYPFRPVFALDHDHSACLTYRFNRPYLAEDSVVTEDIIRIVESGRIPKAPLIVGGPPCQGFSTANRQRLTDDPRNYLYKYFIRSVEQSGAVICLVENVPGMLTARKAVENDFGSIGFLVKPFLVNAKDFGYPQNRNRIFWFGMKTDDTAYFEQAAGTFGSILLAPNPHGDFALADAIFDLPALEAKTEKNATNLENDRWGYTIAAPRSFDTEYSRLLNGSNRKTFLLNHKTKYNNPRDIEIYSRLKPGEKSDAESIQDINPYKNRDGIFKDKFFKLEPDKPCKTITAHMYYDCHMYIHPTQARGLTPREAARIQGFPDDYFFLGSPNEWYRQIGNAVSPLVARRVGKALNGVIQTYGIDLR